MDASPFEQHLGTNYVPPDEDVPQIERLLHTYTGEAEALEQGINELEKVLSLRKERLTAYQRAIRDHKALLSPIRRIPADIISTIFHECAFHPTPISGRHPAVVLSHVCHDWRTHVLAQRTLWSKIFVQVPVFPAATLTRARKSWQLKIDKLTMLFDVWATRSAHRPLTLQMDIPPSGATEWRTDDARIRKLFDCIRKTSARWQEIKFYAHIHQHVQSFTILFEISAEDVPILESVDIEVFLVDDTISRRKFEKIPSSSGIFKTPSLRRLTLRGAWGCLHPNAMAKTWRDLERLDLWVDSRKEDAPTLDSIALLHYLKNIPNLRSFDFALDSSRPLPLQPVSVSMESVTEVSFYLHQQLFPRALSQYLTLPTLHSLEIYIAHDDPVDEDDGLVRFMSQVGKTIKVLSLQLDKFAPLLLSTILSHVPLLEDLTSNLDSEEQEIEESSTRPDYRVLSVLNQGGGSLPCPKLRHFQMAVQNVYTDGSFEEALLAFLARRFSEADNGRCSRLEFVEIEFPDGMREVSMDMVQELTNQGIDTGGCVINFTYPIFGSSTS